MRRIGILAGAMAMMVVLVGGMALAKSISCPNRDNGLCVGTNARDTLTGTNKADTIKALGGVDAVTARGGNDKVSGGSDADTLRGGGGNDTINGGGSPAGRPDSLIGDAGDDTLVESPGPDSHAFLGDWGEDRITGDPDAQPGSTDSVCFLCGNSVVSVDLTIDLSTGRTFETAAGPTGPNTVTWTPGVIEHAYGGFGDDTITGNAGVNDVKGALGADSINVAGDGGGDFVDCGNNDSATDTVTMDAEDFIEPGTCDEDTIVTVP